MKALLRMAIVALWILNARSAHAARQSIVYFTHPTPTTGKSFIFATNDPTFHVDYGPNKCGQPFLGGRFMGMPDPSIKDPTRVCGWGKVYGIKIRNTGTAPVSILPIEAPMPVEAGGAADAAMLIRNMLPKIDKSDGDKMPVVIQIRDTIRSLDVLNSAKSMPKRYVQK